MPTPKDSSPRRTQEGAEGNSISTGLLPFSALSAFSAVRSLSAASSCSAATATRALTKMPAVSDTKASPTGTPVQRDANTPPPSVPSASNCARMAPPVTPAMPRSHQRAWSPMPPTSNIARPPRPTTPPPSVPSRPPTPSRRNPHYCLAVRVLIVLWLLRQISSPPTTIAAQAVGSSDPPLGSAPATREIATGSTCSVSLDRQRLQTTSCRRRGRRRRPWRYCAAMTSGVVPLTSFGAASDGAVRLCP